MEVQTWLPLVCKVLRLDAMGVGGHQCGHRAPRVQGVAGKEGPR